MSRLLGVVIVAAMCAGCRSSAPVYDPFMGRTTVPPPGTAVVQPGQPYYSAPPAGATTSPPLITPPPGASATPPAVNSGLSSSFTPNVSPVSANGSCADGNGNACFRDGPRRDAGHSGRPTAESPSGDRTTDLWSARRWFGLSADLRCADRKRANIGTSARGGCAHAGKSGDRPQRILNWREAGELRLVEFRAFRHAGRVQHIARSKSNSHCRAASFGRADIYSRDCIAPHAKSSAIVPCSGNHRLAAGEFRRQGIDRGFAGRRQRIGGRLWIRCSIPLA